ncbi:MAG: SusC/RagA family TonB-linked outer membrane protein [Saprospiraceae bacterium]|nr:SusC/RagA family TonB-linked outer membrane protein [Saprospiraceae bacterium]
MKKLSLVLSIILFCVGGIIAQRTVTGVVNDASSSPLIGASILVKGTATGTITDVDGNFSISIPDGNNMLVVSYTGFETQEVDATGLSTIEIVMAEGVVLKTAVVTALGIKREEKAVGYAVQEVGDEAITRSGATSALGALRGKAAGVTVTQSSGAAGGGQRIIIRGQTSLSGNNQALLVVDGVRINNSSFQTESNVAGVANSNRGMDINPDDIASVNVLKGAAATALYGVDGANGVIIITTKKGASGDKRFNASAGYSVAFDRVSNLPQLQNQYAQGGGGAYRNPATGYPLSFGPAIDTIFWDGTDGNPYDKNGNVIGATEAANTPGAIPVSAYDNLGNVFQTGITNQANFSIDGGDEDANFRFSMSNLNQEGVIPKNTYERTTFRLGSGLKLTDKLNVQASASYVKSEGYRIQQGSNTSGLLLGLLRTSPTFDNTNGIDDPANDPASYTMPDGSQRNYRGGGGYDNPFWIINNAPRIDETNRFMGNLSINYALDQWFNVNATVGTDVYSDRRIQNFEIGSRTAPAGRVQEDDFFFRNFDGYFNVNGRGSLSDKINMGYLAGVNLYDEKLENFYTTGNGLAFPGFVNISNASEVSSGKGLFRQRNMGIYAQVDFAFDDFLFLAATARQDYVSSLVNPDVEFDASSIGFIYPSVNLGFVFSELMPKSDFLTFGKLRASYAEVGGGAPSAYGTSTVFTQAAPGDGWVDGITFPFAGTTSFTKDNTLGNPNLVPERSITTEVGLDLRFFGNRLGLDATYYNRKSIDMILPVALPGSTGYTSALLNAGELSSKGYEIILTTTPIERDNFSWDLLVNFDKNVTLVERLAEGIESQYLGGFISYNIAGQPFGVIYGGAYQRDNTGDANDDGLTLPDGNIVINDDPSSPEYGYQVPDASLRVVGNPNPDFTVGFNNTLTYKDLKLSFLIDWKQGGEMWNGTQWALTYFGMSQVSAENRGDVVVFDGVLSDGSPNNIPATLDQSYYTSSVSGFGSVDEGFVQSTSWVRLREISLSYDLNPKMFSGNFIEGGSVFVTGRNLWFWTPYEGVDPETSLTGSSNNGQGVDYFNMPGTRSVIAGVNLKF